MKPSQIVEEFSGQMRLDALKHELAQLDAKRADLIKRIKDVESSSLRIDKLSAVYKTNIHEAKKKEVGVNCCSDPATHSFIKKGLVYTECENCGAIEKEKKQSPEFLKGYNKWLKDIGVLDK